MKYIIMAGGKYEGFKIPKQLLKVNGEVIIERTIRLLRENGIKDIFISTDNPAFNYLDVPKLKHNNYYESKDGKIYGHWLEAFYPTDEPTCYIFGDVYFSDEAIKTIVKTETEDIELFGSAPPFAFNYIKRWIEPFALKVVNTDHLKESIQKTKELAEEGKTWRKDPIMWELWTVIKDVPLEAKPNEYIYNYKSINDYTTDLDDIEDVTKIENCLKLGGEFKMIKVKALREFTYGDFDKIKNLARNNNDKNQHGRLYSEDTFECSKEMADYLTGGCGYELVKVIEVIPDPVVEEKVEEIKEEPKVEETIVEEKATSKKNKKSKRK